MPIWKLNPIDLSHRDWEASRYQREVIVRAESEERAQQIAAYAFGIATTVPLGEEVRASPWKQSTLVSITEVRDESYPRDGNEEIVGPPEALEYIA